jgi:ankyrin repeat protein
MPGWELPDRSCNLLHVAAFFGLPTLLGGFSVLRNMFNDWINHRCNLEMDPLHWAIRNGHEEITKILFDRGAIPHRTGYGLPALVWAVRNGNEGVIRLLISRGVDLNKKAYGMTPLHWAAWDGREEIVRLLLNQASDPVVRTSSQDLEIAYYASKKDDDEFPWTTVEEANRIYQIVEANDNILTEKGTFGRTSQFGRTRWQIFQSRTADNLS